MSRHQRILLKMFKWVVWMGLAFGALLAAFWIGIYYPQVGIWIAIALLAAFVVTGMYVDAASRVDEEIKREREG